MAEREAHDAGRADVGIIDATLPDAEADADPPEDAGLTDAQPPEAELPGCGWVEDGRWPGNKFLDFDGALAWTKHVDDQRRLYWLAADQVVRHVDLPRSTSISGVRNLFLRHFPEGQRFRMVLRHVDVETGVVSLLADHTDETFNSSLRGHEWVADGEVYGADDVGRVYAYGPVEQLVTRTSGKYSHGEANDFWFAVQEDGWARIHRIREGVRSHFDVDGRITWMGEGAWAVETPDGAVIQARVTDEGLWQHPTGAGCLSSAQSGFPTSM